MAYLKLKTTTEVEAVDIPTMLHCCPAKKTVTSCKLMRRVGLRPQSSGNDLN